MPSQAQSGYDFVTLHIEWMVVCRMEHVLLKISGFVKFVFSFQILYFFTKILFQAAPSGNVDKKSLPLKARRFRFL